MKTMGVDWVATFIVLVSTLVLSVIGLAASSNPSIPQEGLEHPVAATTALDIELDRSLNTAQRKCRVRRQARFDQRGLGDAEFIVGGLQPLIVQERDANRAIGRERRGEQARSEAMRVARDVLAVCFHHFTVELRRDDAVYQRHAAVR